MGATLSAAQASEKPIKDVNHNFTDAPKNHPDMSGKPPPECPMHNKLQQEPVVSECPIGGGGGYGDINPLNMVRKSLYCSIRKKC